MIAKGIAKEDVIKVAENGADLSDTERIYKKHKNEIWTSAITLQELILIARRENIDSGILIESMINLCEIKDVNLDTEMMLTSVEIMKKYNATFFDALHAVACNNDEIISSDSFFDRIGLKRIKLEF